MPQPHGKLVARLGYPRGHTRETLQRTYAATVLMPHEYQANPCAYRIEIQEIRDARYDVL
jgi:hypothetical protein